MKTQITIRNRLREAARAMGSVADRWVLQTSNSFRRIGTLRGDGNVLRGHVQQHDGHPDLASAPGVLDYIVAAQPSVVISLLEDLDMAEERLQKTQLVVEGILTNIDELTTCGFIHAEMWAILSPFRTALATIHSPSSDAAEVVPASSCVLTPSLSSQKARIVE
jgi:hypothetical protein